MPRPPDAETDLQLLLRLAAAVVLLVLFSFLVVAAVIVPIIFDRELDTTLVLGLAASILGAIPVMLGVSIALRGKDNG